MAALRLTMAPDPQFHAEWTTRFSVTRRGLFAASHTLCNTEIIPPGKARDRRRASARPEIVNGVACHPTHGTTTTHRLRFLKLRIFRPRGIVAFPERRIREQ